MSAQAPRGRVRLAELVAALSLGIDLGFGQPMEHVLRQCLIALRLAERVGLDEESRAVVYYTALLIGVGCHSDAHEQAKWFGDDIEMKSHNHRRGGVRVRPGRPVLHEGPTEVRWVHDSWDCTRASVEAGHGVAGRSRRFTLRWRYKILPFWELVWSRRATGLSQDAKH